MSAQPKVYILSGMSGAGKSTESKKIAKDHGGEDFVLIVSADHYFTRLDGSYKFNPKDLPDAHGSCLLEFTEAVYGNRHRRRDCRAVIVDNTNISTIEMAPYVSLAMACGCEVEIVTLHCDPKVAAARNVHGVPLPTIQRMDQNLRHRQLPPFWNVKQRTVNTDPAS